MLDQKRDDAIIALLAQREEDLARIGRMLHDDLGQVLSAVGLHLDALRLDLQTQVPEIVSRTSDIQSLLERAIGCVRELSYELNPSVVERAGLQFALQQLCGRLRRAPGTSVTINYDPAVRLPLLQANAFFRIVSCATEAASGDGCTDIRIDICRNQSEVLLNLSLNWDSDAPAFHAATLAAMRIYADRANEKLDVIFDKQSSIIVKVSYQIPLASI